MTPRPAHFLTVALALAGCLNTTDAARDRDPAPVLSARIEASGTDMGAALNRARAQNGRPAARPNAALMAAALEQARHMASTNAVQHSGSGGSNVGQRVRRAGCAWTWVGENVAGGQPTDQAAMDGWMASAGHRRNVLNPAATSYGSASVGTYRSLVLASGC